MSALSVRSGPAQVAMAREEVVCGVDLDVARGRVLRAARSQRRRQDHHAAALPRPDRSRRGRDPPARRAGAAARAREARARVGVVPQFDNLDPDFTVAENLLVYGRYFGIAARTHRGAHPGAAGVRRPRRPRRCAHQSAFRRHEAAAHARARARQRSGAAVHGRADHRPRPAGAPPDLGAAAPPHAGGQDHLLTTHFMDEAERLCDRLAIMDHGRIIAQGTPRELIAQHIEPQVVEVYGDGAEAWMRAGAHACAARRARRRDGVLLHAGCRPGAAQPGRPRRA